MVIGKNYDWRNMSVLILEDDFNRIKKFRSEIPSARIVETADQMIELIKNNQPVEMLMLDHDLGMETFVSINNKNTGSMTDAWTES